ncbi:hypothetical protein L2E82_49916 [Cichorium intybus]|uniref:Uncharacterized protein n=1 Tax=Cichorium intybus TaxID=13427 RepID=A0ACB8Z1I2_CICIN|nr:hypothetical protein L2E82_49916 [Cichorium intybus]
MDLHRIGYESPPKYPPERISYGSPPNPSTTYGACRSMPPSAFNTLAIDRLVGMFMSDYHGADFCYVDLSIQVLQPNSMSNQHHLSTPKSPLLKPLTTGNRQDDTYNPIIEDILCRG